MGHAEPRRQLGHALVGMRQQHDQRKGPDRRANTECGRWLGPALDEAVYNAGQQKSQKSRCHCPVNHGVQLGFCSL